MSYTLGAINFAWKQVFLVDHNYNESTIILFLLYKPDIISVSMHDSYMECATHVNI